MPRQPDPDPFQIEVAQLAGLDPEKVIANSLNVDISRGDDGAVALVTARVAVEVDADALVALAVKYDRIHPAMGV